MRIDNQIIVKAEASGGSHPAIVATVPLTATASKAALASSFIDHLMRIVAQIIDLHRLFACDLVLLWLLLLQFL